MANPFAEKYLRTETMPHIWCPGCGNGIIMRDICMAIDRNELDPTLNGLRLLRAQKGLQRRLKQERAHM